MDMLFYIMGIFCILYYLIIIMYAGFSADFSKFWLVAGLLLLIYLYVYEGLEAYALSNQWLHILIIGTGFFVLFILILFIAVQVCIIKAMYVPVPQNLDYIIVLGAQVKKELPSNSLKKRLDRACGYLVQNPGTKAVLSGGQGPGEAITEAEAMKRYLTEQNIDVSRMILEDKSTSTYQNIIFSFSLIDKEKNSIGIVSNNFHIYRALKLAEKQGCINPKGISASSDRIMQVHFMVREFFAVVKDKLYGNI